jgi:peroxiredoxin
MLTPDPRTSNLEPEEAQLAETTGQLPEVGQPMPDFSLTGTDRSQHSVSDLTRDHRGMVLFFFPKANTSG